MSKFLHDANNDDAKAMAIRQVFSLKTAELIKNFEMRSLKKKN